MLSYGPPLLLLASIVAVALVLGWRRRGVGLQRHPSAGLRTLEVAAVGSSDRLVLAECLGRRYLLAQGSQGLVMLDRWPEAAGAALVQPDAAAPTGPSA
jgi:hypothetical protein